MSNNNTPAARRFTGVDTLFASPLRAALLFTLFGVCWIVGTDMLVDRLITDPGQLLLAQNVKGLLFVGGTALLVYWLARRILHGMERKRAEEQLQSTRHLLEKLLGSMGDSVILIDPATRTIVQCNPAAERMFGYTQGELIGASTELLHVDRESYEHFGALGEPILAQQGVFRTEFRMKRKDGTRIDTENTVTTLSADVGWQQGVISIVRDITERKALEEQLRRSQRLESVGQLTGGIAHDFNNLLTVILGNAELLEEQLPENSPLRPIAEMVVQGAQRGAELTHRLLAFARKQALDPKAVDVNQLVTAMDRMLRRTLGEQIEIELVRGAGLWPALVDPGQLENALLNLALNARDAMPGGGRLTIETANIRIDRDYAERHADVQPGQYVLVAVSDTGDGIPAEHLERVFEPFYTTKATGKGTGLGLSMVYGFVKQSGGHVNIYSEPGQGTTIRMYLPRPVGTSEQHGKPAPDLPGTGGRETILLVEDDALVLDYAAGQLDTLGYRVIKATNGPEALAILRRRDDIDLLFTDIVMPGGMSGRDLAEAARAIHPNLKVLYTSGYTENAIVHHGRLDPGVQLLGKPYRRSDLARKLREVLCSG